MTLQKRIRQRTAQANGRQTYLNFLSRGRQASFGRSCARAKGPDKTLVYPRLQIPSTFPVSDFRNPKTSVEREEDSGPYPGTTQYLAFF